jgi:benzodiazapine receptor
LRKIWLSLIIVILMWIFILLTIIEFFKINKMAGLILLPYLLWVSLATYLNAYIYVFNK